MPTGRCGAGTPVQALVQLHNKAYSCLLSRTWQACVSAEISSSATLRRLASSSERVLIGLVQLCRCVGVCLFQLIKTQY